MLNISRNLLLSTALVLVTGLMSPSAHAADASRRAAIIARALSYEQTLLDRSSGALTVGILYSGTDDESSVCATEWEVAWSALSKTKVQGLAVKAFTYDVSAHPVGSVPTKEPAVLVVCTVTDAHNAEISSMARSEALLTVGNVRKQVESGMSLGVFDAGGRTKIVVNLKACSKESVQFSSQLLKLAEILR